MDDDLDVFVPCSVDRERSSGALKRAGTAIVQTLTRKIGCAQLEGQTVGRDVCEEALGEVRRETLRRCDERCAVLGGGEGNGRRME